MSPDKQRTAIAGFCGWKYPCSSCFNNGYKDRWRTPTGLGCVADNDLPNYLNDLNAMREAEKQLDIRQQDCFAAYLGAIVEGRQIDREATRINATTEMLFATAAQHAEALLRTIGKWEET